jgi:hypothetical protein
METGLPHPFTQAEGITTPSFVYFTAFIVLTFLSSPDGRSIASGITAYSSDTKGNTLTVTKLATTAYAVTTRFTYALL